MMQITKYNELNIFDGTEQTTPCHAKALSDFVILLYMGIGCLDI